ncbi:hypothetical protein [Thermithiobacillus plumbiphilus]|uniref:Conjugal transfer protein TraN n=1 Tax=Thermithiobacillus plumbiphilus TaxID=1729899 RepID=A0ABU9DA17_9PROT
MNKLCRRVSSLLVGACIAAPLSGWAEAASTDEKDNRPEASQEQRQIPQQDRKAWENAPMPNRQIIPPGVDMPIIIQEKPVNTGIVKQI